MLEGLTPPAKKPLQCKLSRLREGLEKSDQKILDGAVANVEDWPTETLVRELRKHGLDVGRETIRAHRRGDCVCVSQ
jgi:hypothetical protein